MRSGLIALLLVSTAAAARTEDRSVPSFDAVHIGGGLRADVSLASGRQVRLDGDPALLDEIETVVEDGTLRVGFKERTWRSGRRTGEVRVTITAPALRSIGASGGSIVRAALTRADSSEIAASGGSEMHVRGVEAGQLEIEASGGSIVEVQGRADALDLGLSGGAQLHGRDLETGIMRVQASGGSQGELRVSRRVRGALSGGSILHVRGRPSSKVAKSGGSELALGD